MNFYGRNKELQDLDSIWHLNHVKMVVIKGRRRVGKSRLIQQYSKKYKFVDFVGVLTKATRVNDPSVEVIAQFENLSVQFEKHFGRRIQFKTWSEFFRQLEIEINKIDEKTILLFDEISWMGQHSPNFVGQLKNFRDDIHHKANIMLVLCGSISLWIEDKIIKSRALTGRIDLPLTINELPLMEANNFFPEGLSNREKLKILMVTGGIPKYLEAFNFKLSFESNLEQLAFNESGILLNDFESIFYDSLSSNSDKYLDIVEYLAEGKRTFIEIDKYLVKKYKLNEKDSLLPARLRELELAGFIAKDPFCSISGKPSKSSFYRLKDNYVRFYLKVIKKNKHLIEKRNQINLMEAYSNFASIQGLQFENLVHNNFYLLVDYLKIKNVSSIGPLNQKGTPQQKGVQIDLLIKDSYKNLYLFEIKFKEQINKNLIQEIKEKDKNLIRPKKMSLRKYLVYSGDLIASVAENKTDFNDLIDFELFLGTKD